MTTWPPKIDPFYEDFSDYFVCALWNGIKPDGSGRQNISFLGARRATLGDYALATIWPDEAEFFHEREDAVAFLEKQDTLRPAPLGKGWEVLTVGELEEKYGYRPLSKLITIGNQNLAHPARPGTPAANAPTP